MEQHLIFAPGTRVRLIKDSILDKGREGLIEHVSLDTGYITYSFCGCAWFYHEEFEFLEAPTVESIQQLLDVVNEDEEEEDLEDEDVRTGVEDEDED